MAKKNNEPYEYKPREIEDMSDRYLRFGAGKISGYSACALGILCLMAVLCFKFPVYLTVTEMRQAYDVDFMRTLLLIGLWGSVALGFIGFCLAKDRRPPAIGLLCTGIAFVLGGHTVVSGDTTHNSTGLALGLDWLVLALVASVTLFTFLEKIFPKYKSQAILRPEWQLDLIYFCFNHLIFTFILLIGNYFTTTVFNWAVSDTLQNFVQDLPVVVQVLILIVCADFVLYWSHRTFHETPWLWKIHAVHHSVEHMDWLAGSRNHIVQTIVDRCIALVPLYLIGPDKAALDIYVIFAGLQAVMVHANLGIPFGPLKYIICTPQYHHWHHSSEAPAIDTNYAVHMPLFDMIFGTYHMPDKHWPAHYGTTVRLPRTFFKQLTYPFTRRGKKK